MNTIIGERFPITVFANSGTTVSLQGVLSAAFGDEWTHYSRFYLSSYDQSFLTANNFSYWDPTHPAFAHWNLNGSAVPSGFGNTPLVTAANIQQASFTAGNGIMNTLLLDVETSAADHVYTRYSINILPTSVAAPDDTSVDPQDIVNAALRFNQVFGGVQNANDCGFICSAVAGDAGAVMPVDMDSIVPSQNREGGYWRIVHRGTDDPISDWQSLVRPGDVVRLDWSDPTAPQHTTLVLSTQRSDGTIEVLDNGARVGGSATTTIGVHSANYDVVSDPSSITIYRLTPDHLYLIEGTDFGETTVGTFRNDDIRTYGGADAIFAGAGDDVIRPGAGNDNIDGGVGVDIVVYSGLRSQYQIAAFPSGSINVTDLRDGSPDGADTLSNIELLQFADRTVAPNDPSNASRAERFFDSATGDHFYTMSAAEANQIRATLPTYHDEGAPWSTPDRGSNTIDIFRFFDAATGAHFLTSSTAERDHVIATLPSYHFEGIAFEAYSAPSDGTLTLERFFNTQTHLHHYAASAAETASILNGGAGPGWVDEGAGFIVHT
jgi:Repeat of unknown function (DUF5648)